MKQMPTEGEEFRAVDAHWREIIQETNKDPDALVVMKIPSLLDKLTASNAMLDNIQKGLNEYLETKRLYFSRFFFLSNDELLESLSETKDPLRVKPHLKKCFEGIHDITFEENLDIVEMISAETEAVQLVEKINPMDSFGAVEVWLVQLEDMMRVTIKDVVAEAMADYPTKKREDWVLAWPGQVALCVSQMYWTQDVEKALSSKGVNGIIELLPTLDEQLTGELCKMEFLDHLDYMYALI